MELNATQAKFTASGELRLWGDVALVQNGLQKGSSKISISHEQKTNSLNLYFDRGKEEPLRFNFPTNESSNLKKVTLKSVRIKSILVRKLFESWRIKF